MPIKRSEISEIPAVILCGGKGTRLGHLTQDVPKPLILIGNKPILWHVMKIYASQGVKKFILCLGYKKDKIRNYFKNNSGEDWDIQFVDTGLETSKSQRIQHIKNLIKAKNFFCAYGDDVADINLNKLLKLHQRLNPVATITVIKMVSGFGIVKIDRSSKIRGFKEKPVLDVWMNGGFMVLNKKIFNYLDIGELEEGVFNALVRNKQINAYKHQGNWKTMNTLKDYMELTSLWDSNKAFWKTWKE